MKVQIFAVGHSITQGYWDTRGGWVQRLRTYLDEKTLENPEKFYFEVYNLGISGNDTNQIIERFDSEIEQRIDNDSQTIILLQAGVNDTIYLTSDDALRVSEKKFEKNNYELIRKAKEYTDTIIFVNDGYTAIEGEIPWSEDKEYSDKRLETYLEIQKKVCEKSNIPLIDFRNIFGKQDWLEMLEDGVHPNNKGHNQIFLKVREKMDEELF